MSSKTNSNNQPSSDAKQDTTIFKYIIIGDMGVGKSCLLSQFTENRFSESTPTFGVEIGTRDIEIDGKQIKIQIWDTAGQERFRAVTRSYYKETACAFLVYDITRRETFLHLTSWLTDAKNLTSPNTTIIMIGNKLDLADQRGVSFEEATTFAQENDLMYIETSAKTGERVDEAFLSTAKGIHEKIQNGTINPEQNTDGVTIHRVIISPGPEPARGIKCC